MTADLHNFVARKNIGAAKGLLQSLVPRAQCFCFYDLDRNCVWSSDGADDYEVDSYITELPLEIVAGQAMNFQVTKILGRQLDVELSFLSGRNVADPLGLWRGASTEPWV